jgi:hypothetical protein
MSIELSVKRKTPPDIRSRKGAEPIVMLTSYYAQTAAPPLRRDPRRRLTGNVMQCFATTVPVTLEMMLHGSAVVMNGKSFARCQSRAVRMRGETVPRSCARAFETAEEHGFLAGKCERASLRHQLRVSGFDRRRVYDEEVLVCRRVVSGPVEFVTGERRNAGSSERRPHFHHCFRDPTIAGIELGILLLGPACARQRKCI